MKKAKNIKNKDCIDYCSFFDFVPGSYQRMMEKGSLKIAELTIGYEYALKFISEHYPEKSRINHWHDVKINLYI